jgi:5-formyltetrahydrofolate cyclo-ligase
MLKEGLRRAMRLRKQQYSQQQLKELSQPVIARLKPRLAEAQTVLAYYSLPDEVYTHLLLDNLVAEGKTVLLPKVLDAERMEVRRYTGPHDLTEGSFGIMEPTGEPFTDYHLIDIALIPGIAFDAEGHRLGRGRGYYDRFLSSHLLTVPTVPEPVEGVEGFTPHLIGVCFDFQKVESVPHDANDIPVDMVI